MDRLLLAQTIVYFVIFVTGLATSIASGIARDNFGATCILYGGGECSASNTTVFTITRGRTSVCTFIPAINLIVGVLYGFSAFCYHAYQTHRSKINTRAAYMMPLKTLCFAAVLVIVLTIAAATSLTAGLSKWCTSILDSENMHNGTSIVTCSNTQLPDITWILPNTTSSGNQLTVTAGEYYYEYSAAQSSCWFAVVLWLIVIAACIYRIIKHRQQQTSYQDPFIMDAVEDAFT